MDELIEKTKNQFLQQNKGGNTTEKPDQVLKKINNLTRQVLKVWLFFYLLLCFV